MAHSPRSTRCCSGIDTGEDPASLQLDEFDELIVDFGRRIGTRSTTPLHAKARYLTGTEFVIDAGLLTR